MILRRQSDPGGEVPAGAEDAGIWKLHDQRRSRDRSNAGDRRQTPAAFVRAVPRLELAIERLHLGLDRVDLLGQSREQLTCASRNPPAGRNPPHPTTYPPD